jgi:hypothetical protein
MCARTGQVAVNACKGTRAQLPARALLPARQAMAVCDHAVIMHHVPRPPTERVGWMRRGCSAPSGASRRHASGRSAAAPRLSRRHEQCLGRPLALVCQRAALTVVEQSCALSDTTRSIESHSSVPSPHSTCLDSVAARSRHARCPPPGCAPPGWPWRWCACSPARSPPRWARGRVRAGGRTRQPAGARWTCASTPHIRRARVLTAANRAAGCGQVRAAGQQGPNEACAVPPCGRPAGQRAARCRPQLTHALALRCSV